MSFNFNRPFGLDKLSLDTESPMSSSNEAEATEEDISKQGRKKSPLLKKGKPQKAGQQNDLRLRCTYPHPKGFRIDYVKLEADLIKEVQADELYWIQNAAKLRAVAQPGTYEDFRQIVLGAHLKPLKKEETDALRNDAKKGRVVWNTLAENGKHEHGMIPGGSKLENIQLEFELPKSTTEFCVTWKKCTDWETKINFLKYLLESKVCGQEGSSALKNLFAEEVPPEILPQILGAFMYILNLNMSSLDETQFIMKTLQIIGDSKKFDLTQAFLSRSDLNMLNEVFEKLNEKLQQKPEENSYDFQGTKPVDLLNVIKSRYDMNKILCFSNN